MIRTISKRLGHLGKQSVWQKLTRRWMWRSKRAKTTLKNEIQFSIFNCLVFGCSFGVGCRESAYPECVMQSMKHFALALEPCQGSVWDFINLFICLFVKERRMPMLATELSDDLPTLVPKWKPMTNFLVFSWCNPKDLMDFFAELCSNW